MNLSAMPVTLYLGAETRLPETGAKKMTSGEIGVFIFMVLACILWAICSYAVGYKEGHKDGYQRGKAVGRHASGQAVR